MIHWIDRMKQVKLGLIVSALVIAAVSLVVSHTLIRDLEAEERNRMSVWAEAMRSLIKADANTDLSLVLKVLNGNNSIPVIVLDAQSEVLDSRNIKLVSDRDTTLQLRMLAEQMETAGHSMRMSLLSEDSDQDFITICYDESVMLKRLATYPYVQLGVVALFIAVAIYALLSSKRAEQNKVWVGLSRETAHQLGTPISSLMAWSQVLGETYPDDPLLPEMDKDIRRLELIAERFSKIGSAPELVPCNIKEVVARVVDYMSRRAPNAVRLTSSIPEDLPSVSLNPPLFEWVIENLCKNAIDAMAGKGAIDIRGFAEGKKIVVEVTDTGKGIAKQNFKNVFRPGFTSKKRGWGLGLSLAKRIVSEYHNGKIYVKHSQIGVGTTFAIEIKVEP